MATRKSSSTRKSTKQGKPEPASRKPSAGELLAAAQTAKEKRDRIESLFNMRPRTDANPINAGCQPEDSIYRALCVLQFVKRAVFSSSNCLEASDIERYGGHIVMEVAMNAIESTTESMANVLNRTRKAMLIDQGQELTGLVDRLRTDSEPIQGAEA